MSMLSTTDGVHQQTSISTPQPRYPVAITSLLPEMGWRVCFWIYLLVTVACSAILQQTLPQIGTDPTFKISGRPRASSISNLACAGTSNSRRITRTTNSQCGTPNVLMEITLHLTP